MKINNRNFIKKWSLGIIMFVFACFLFTSFYIILNIPYRKTIILIFGLIAFVGLLMMKEMKFSEIENSGEVLSINTQHFFKILKFYPSIEIPVTCIKKIDIFKFGSKYIIMISLITDKNKTKVVNYSLVGIHRSQFEKLKSTFKENKMFEIF